MKKIAVCALMALMSVPVWADVNNEEEEFASDERTEEGFVTKLLNESIAKSMPASEGEVEYGRKVTGFATAPKFGGYFIGKYEYSSQDGKENGSGFSQRLVRAYVDGKILGDFTYRVQVQMNNGSFHMKDYFIEWGKFKEFKVKLGQYKRAFGFENPMNPWVVGNYSQLTSKLTGHNDYIGAESSSNGGRDQGIQVQGDLFPVGKDKHSLVHYQLMIANGQGINSSDANKRKDIIGTIQLQPIKGLVLGFFGWTGNATYNGITADRNRYMISAKYDANDWTVRAEYAHSTGHKISDFYTAANVANSITAEKVVGGLKENASNGRADAWYATVGIPMTSWLKTYVKYDVYRDDASWNTTKSIYSICPNIQLHKNLMFQLEYNYVHDKTLAAGKRSYSQVWLETYVRF